MEIEVSSIDLGETVFSIAELDANDGVVLRKQLQWHRLLKFLANLPTCIVAMEACAATHHFGRYR